MNQITIHGRMVRDPELKTCPAAAQRVEELFRQKADAMN